MEIDDVIVDDEVDDEVVGIDVEVVGRVDVEVEEVMGPVVVVDWVDVDDAEVVVEVVELVEVDEVVETVELTVLEMLVLVEVDVADVVGTCEVVDVEVVVEVVVEVAVDSFTAPVMRGFCFVFEPTSIEVILGSGKACIWARTDAFTPEGIITALCAAIG